MNRCGSRACYYVVLQSNCACGIFKQWIPNRARSFLHTALQNLPFEPNRGSCNALKCCRILWLPAATAACLSWRYAAPAKPALYRPLPEPCRCEAAQCAYGTNRKAAKKCSVRMQRCPRKTIHRKILKRPHRPMGGPIYEASAETRRNTVFCCWRASMIGADMGRKACLITCSKTCLNTCIRATTVKLLLMTRPNQATGRKQP